MTIRNWTPKRLADQTGKTFVISGANSGIGFKAGKHLVEAGGHVIMLCRNLDKAGIAARKLRLHPALKNPTVLVVVDRIDLDSQIAGTFYAADMANAQRRVDMAIAALEQAKDELARSQIAFIAHCREIELPIEMEPAMYPPRQYRLED